MDSIETGMFLLPKQLHAYYRVLPHLMYIADCEDRQAGGKGPNVFKPHSSDKVKFSLERMKKLFKSFPIIPLYADMHIDVMFVLRRCKNWDEETMAESWTTAVPKKLRERYELLYQRQKIRADYTEFTARFTSMLNEIMAFTAAKRIITPKMLTAVFHAVLEGLKLLSAWSAKVAEQCAFKYSRPRSDAEYRAAGGRTTDATTGKAVSGHEYEKAVKYNYSPEELYALIDVIGMIKGLGALMLDSQMTHEPLVRRCIHDDTQIFLQQELARPLRKAHKKNKKVREQCITIANICGCFQCTLAVPFGPLSPSLLLVGLDDCRRPILFVRTTYFFYCHYL
jgi:cytoplasmic FMR1 interacting protein